MTCNKVFVMGCLGDDPATGEKDGKRWARVSLAVGGGDGFKPTWVKVWASGKGAETLTSCKKGDLVFVEGQLCPAKTQDGKFCGCDIRAWAVCSQAKRQETDPVTKVAESNRGKEPPEDEIPI